ncbi:hypothetical protein BDQ94DRAFT_137888 [Aspergillus welwitschiae]|uniref:Uncharacterized protein n=1 Tax=Aspergillus welwitschiae TaxID=1341132 RepID=A0A3F3QB74_9EURO|nr:hypothetical protein BDQ94DRAFT_137888 [Aspergillus welwitschiae]RDH36494.1 hypothetical protein BDQ94DRAFT_137888 [Aspergillus welwitschiae]
MFRALICRVSIQLQSSRSVLGAGSKQGTAIHFRQPSSTMNWTRLCFACITQTTRPQHRDEVRVHAGGLESVSQADNADVPLCSDAWAVIE